MTMPEWRRRLAAAQPIGDWWRNRHHCADAVLGATHISHDVCCARSNAIPHDGKCQWCPAHDGSSDVDKVRYTDAHDYEDYSTDVRPLVLAKRR
jgi:hypothetical protein